MPEPSRLAVAVVAAVLAMPAAAAPLPPPVAAMIEASAGDEAALKAVVEAAKKTNPGSVAEIDALVARLGERAAAEREARLAAQGFLDGWDGEGQAGAYVSSGNVDDLGLSLGLALRKETRRWRHGLDAILDYQETEDIKTRERYFLGYTGNWKFDDRLYAYLLLSGERDRFAGYNSRFTESAGLGYRVIDRERLKLDVEGGPALRQTDFVGGDSEFTVSGRVAGNLIWDIAPTTRFTQNASVFLESGNSTITSLSAITTKMSDALSLRASFELRHETDPPFGRKSTDTATRVTVVYDF